MRRPPYAARLSKPVALTLWLVIAGAAAWLFERAAERCAAPVHVSDVSAFPACRGAAR